MLRKRQGMEKNLHTTNLRAPPEASPGFGFPFSLILMAAAVSVTPEPRAEPLLHQQGHKWFPLRAAAVPAISFPECLLVWNTYCLLKETKKKK